MRLSQQSKPAQAVAISKKSAVACQRTALLSVGPVLTVQVHNLGPGVDKVVDKLFL